MLIRLNAWINSQAVRVKADQVGMLINIPNLVAVNSATRKIVALGKTEEEMKKQSPFGWRAWGRRIAFLAPFSPKDFDPGAVKSVLMYYAGRASALARPGTFGQLIGLMVDRFEYDVQFAAYDNAPAGARDDFENQMRAERALRRLRINGRLVKGS